MIGFFIYSEIFPPAVIFESYLNNKQFGYSVLCDKFLKEDYSLPFSEILICINILKSRASLGNAPKKELGNYSKDKKEFTAYITLIYSDFVHLTDKERKIFITDKIIYLLELIRERLKRKDIYSDNYEHLVRDVNTLNKAFVDSPEMIIDTTISKEDQELLDIIKEAEEET